MKSHQVLVLPPRAPGALPSAVVHSDTDGVDDNEDAHDGDEDGHGFRSFAQTATDKLLAPHRQRWVFRVSRHGYHSLVAVLLKLILDHVSLVSFSWGLRAGCPRQPRTHGEYRVTYNYCLVHIALLGTANGLYLPFTFDSH